MNTSFSNLALKTKILRGLVIPPPIPYMILEVREILVDANSSLNDSAYIIHLADIRAKSTGFASGEGETIDEFAAPDILQFLDIQPANQEAMAAAMMNDVQKLEAEIPET
ncbi:MAG: hypothetical protein KJO34_05050 [Deltaproteobacteria bacterium]|nr:hypothetical protein [Deltaproteobacteria bacterium]